MSFLIGCLNYRGIREFFNERQYYSSKNQDQILSRNEFEIFFTNGFNEDSITVLDNKRNTIISNLNLSTQENLGTTLKSVKFRSKNNFIILFKANKTLIKLNDNYRLMYLEYKGNNKWDILYSKYELFFE